MDSEMIRSSKPTLLWIAVKLFDKSVDKVTWLEMMKNLCEKFDVHFLTGWRDRPLDISVCDRPVKYFPQYGRGLLRKVSRSLLMKRAVKDHVNRLSPDVILLNCKHQVDILKVVYTAAKKINSMCVLDIRTLPTVGKDDSAWNSFADNLAFACRYFAGVTYITDEMQRYCIDRFNLPEHQSAVWTSGVNTDLFAPTMAEAEAGPFRLIYHGGIISSSRGLDRLIQAMDLLRDLDVHLTLLSSLREAEAIEWIGTLKLSDSVTLADTIPHEQVPDQVNRHHAGILPFPDCDVWNTSSPIKLFEYLACGKPVIVTDIPAHRNVLEGKPFAFFARDASPTALAGAIRRAHAAREEFPALGIMARQQVLDQHTWSRQADKLGTMLNAITRQE